MNATAQRPETGDRAILARWRRHYDRWAAACYHILDKTGQLVQLRLNRVQRAIGAAELVALEARGEARLFVLKARQGGVSTDQQARALHCCWSWPGANAMTLASTKDDTEKLFGITTRAIEHFPRRALPHLGEAQTHEITFTGLDSSFWTGTGSSKRAGRGLTIRRLHMSEFAFYDDPLGALNAATPALVPRDSVVVLETTGSGHGSPAHEFWRLAADGGTSYVPLFFPWWECDPRHYRLPLLAPDELGAIEPEERLLVERHGLALEQIKWRRQKMRDMGRADFLSEYAEDPETCWLAVGGLFYDVETIHALEARVPRPREVLLNGTLELYEEPPAGERVVIGCDTAEGGGGDRSTWVARSFPSWRLLAQFADNRIAPDPLADLLNEWGRRFQAFQVIEKNAHGITVLRRLRDVHDYPEAELYHRVALDAPEQDQRARLGWATTAESKPLMLDAGRQLMQAALEGRAGPLTRACLRDAYSVRRDVNGRLDLNGKDVLVSEMLAWLGRTQRLPPLELW